MFINGTAQSIFAISGAFMVTFIEKIKVNLVVREIKNFEFRSERLTTDVLECGNSAPSFLGSRK